MRLDELVAQLKPRDGEGSWWECTTVPLPDGTYLYVERHLKRDDDAEWSSEDRWVASIGRSNENPMMFFVNNNVIEDLGNGFDDLDMQMLLHHYLGSSALIEPSNPEK